MAENRADRNSNTPPHMITHESRQCTFNPSFFNMEFLSFRASSRLLASAASWFGGGRRSEK